MLELEEANEASSSDEAEIIDQPHIPWSVVFEDQRKEIIMLWHVCHVSIVHRTQFYLLFKGDPSDQIYMEVELRRLKWLEQHLDEVGNASPALLGDDPPGSVSSRYVQTSLQINTSIDSEPLCVIGHIRPLLSLNSASRHLNRRGSIYRRG